MLLREGPVYVIVCRDIYRDTSSFMLLLTLSHPVLSWWWYNVINNIICTTVTDHRQVSAATRQHETLKLLLFVMFYVIKKLLQLNTFHHFLSELQPLPLSALNTYFRRELIVGMCLVASHTSCMTFHDSVVKYINPAPTVNLFNNTTQCPSRQCSIKLTTALVLSSFLFRNEWKLDLKCFLLLRNILCQRVAGINDKGVALSVKSIIRNRLALTRDHRIENSLTIILQFLTNKWKLYFHHELFSKLLSAWEASAEQTILCHCYCTCLQSQR